MNKQTSEKLKQLADVYPQERIQKSKERWECMWNGSMPVDRYPYTFGWPHFNAYNVNHEPAKRVQAYLDGLLFTGKFEDDLIPSIFPGLHHASIPSMLGAKEKRLGMETACERLIYTAEDIDQLPKPQLIKGTPAYYWLDAAKYFVQETEGKIGIHVCDMQGPFDVAAQLWNYDELIVCAYEDEDRYHKLLNLATDAFIMLWQAQKKICGDAFIGTHLFAHDWISPSVGSTLSADGLVMCSPSFYNEFVAPYITKVAKALGGTVVHSCGDFRPVLKQLCATEGVRGVNASQLSINQLVEAGLDTSKTVVAFTDVQGIGTIMNTVRKHRMGVCLTVGDFYLYNEDSSAKTDLSDAEWKLLKDREARILEIMKV